MIVLGLDPATTSGWAVGERSGFPIFGTFELPGLDDANLQRSLAAMYSGVFTLCKENKVEAAAIEAPLPPVQKTNARGISTPTSYHGVKVLTMLSGAAQAGAYNAGVRLFWLPLPNEWRKQVFGAGYPEDPKATAQKYCRMCHRIESINPDAAEAVCIMQFGFGQVRLL